MVLAVPDKKALNGSLLTWGCRLGGDPRKLVFKFFGKGNGHGFDGDPQIGVRLLLGGLFLEPIPARVSRHMMVFHLGVFSAIQRFDFMDLAVRFAVGTIGEKGARGRELAAGSAVLAFPASLLVDREDASERAFYFGGPIVLVGLGHGNGFKFEKRWPLDGELGAYRMRFAD